MTVSNPLNWSLGARILFVLAILLLCVPGFVHGKQLVDRMPFALTLVSSALGFTIGCLFVSEAGAVIAAQGARGYFALAALPIMTMLVGAYYGRLAFEAAEFAWFDARRSTLVVRVDSSSAGRSGPWAYVQPSGSARQMQVEITRDLYDRLDPIRQPGRDCLRLEIETGRSGYRRAILPAVIEQGLGVDRLIACPGDDR